MNILSEPLRVQRSDPTIYPTDLLQKLLQQISRVIYYKILMTQIVLSSGVRYWAAKDLNL